MKESPKAWEETRDNTLRKLTFTLHGKTHWLSQCITHGSVWLILRELGEEEECDGPMEHPTYGRLPFVCRQQGTVVGAIGAYVDDLLVIAELPLVEAVFGSVRGTWETSEPEILGEKGCTELTYLGVTLEIDQSPRAAVTRVYVHQNGYAHMLLDKFEELAR